MDEPSLDVTQSPGATVRISTPASTVRPPSAPVNFVPVKKDKRGKKRKNKGRRLDHDLDKEKKELPDAPGMSAMSIFAIVLGLTFFLVLVGVLCSCWQKVSGTLHHWVRL